MAAKFILFARRANNANDPWSRINSTKRSTNPVSLKAATAKAQDWLKAGWRTSRPRKPTR